MKSYFLIDSQNGEINMDKHVCKPKKRVKDQNCAMKKGMQIKKIFISQFLCFRINCSNFWYYIWIY
jgi:hypothetical protein